MEVLLALKNETSLDKVESLYRPLIDGAVGAVAECLGSDLLEIRLLGSIPRGCAIPGLSDLDLLAVTGREISQEAVAALRERLRPLPGPAPLVSRIDLQCMSLDTIRGYPEYELILRTDSVSLFGEDHYPPGEVAIWNTELARLWTPDARAILRDYRSALANADIPADEVNRYSRLTGKDMMKCFQIHVLLRYGLIERSVENVYRNLRTYLPQHGELFDRLWSLYRFPTSCREDVLAVLEACQSAMDDILPQEG